jgi:hypothetical protein
LTETQWDSHREKELKLASLYGSDRSVEHPSIVPVEFPGISTPIYTISPYGIREKNHLRSKKKDRSWIKRIREQWIPSSARSALAMIALTS